jgi:hypothetical protein
MEIVLQRIDADRYRTHGRLTVDRDDVCVTLEDGPAKLGAEGKGCIPAGRYRLALTVSPRAQAGGLWTPWPEHRLPLLLDVPGFEGIRIHAGNRAEDTEGCILVGATRTVDAITDSRRTLIALRDLLQFPSYITIKDVEN